jgi:hypothetical protein
VIIPPGLGDGLGVSSSSSLSSDDAVGDGEGVGLAVGFGVAPGEPLGDGDGAGMLKARLQVYC